MLLTNIKILDFILIKFKPLSNGADTPPECYSDCSWNHLSGMAFRFQDKFMLAHALFANSTSLKVHKLSTNQ